MSTKGKRRKKKRHATTHGHRFRKLHNKLIKRK